LKMAQIDGVWVRDSSGHTVLHGYVQHATDQDT
jgi:hypothetical protein